MIKTFEELLNDIPKEDRINNGSKETVINLLKKVREATIKECIKKGYGLYYENIFDKNPTFVDLYEDSIQNLDKESIEIDE